jgi:hypothetical protein
MYRTMQRPLGIFVLRCGFIQSSAIFMVSWIILVISLGSADPLQKPSPAMPRLRLRMRPRRKRLLVTWIECNPKISGDSLIFQPFELQLILLEDSF